MSYEDEQPLSHSHRSASLASVQSAGRPPYLSHDAYRGSSLPSSSPSVDSQFRPASLEFDRRPSAPPQAPSRLEEVTDRCWTLMERNRCLEAELAQLQTRLSFFEPEGARVQTAARTASGLRESRLNYWSRFGVTPF
ncbi:hypothetical protein P7C70_g9271, partial [Phenoliferia sp. Uapishka_3]